VRILATAEVPAVAHDAFAHLGPIEVIDDARALAAAEVLIVRAMQVDADALSSATALRAIARTGAGYDNIDVDAATRLGVPVIYAPGVGSQPVAEGAVALMLAAAKRLPQLDALVRNKAWASRYEVRGLDIEGACLGILGLGAIGRRVARLCHGLGMRVIAHDPALAGPRQSGVSLVTLDELVARADVISLHCDLTDRTRGLVDRDLLARVKPGAILVNVARGEIVESEDALAEALACGRLSAVALDVFPAEPPDPRHRLYADPRVICSPHVVGLTARWNEEVFRALARGVESVLAGELPANVLNPEALARA
jgi:D-3-phosphoglycerate dehydrogenase